MSRCSVKMMIFSFAPSRVAEDLAELLELRVFAALVDLAGQVEQLVDLVALGLQARPSVTRDHAAQRPSLRRLRSLRGRPAAASSSRGLVVEHVAQVSEIALKREQLLLGRAARCGCRRSNRRAWRGGARTSASAHRWNWPGAAGRRSSPDARRSGSGCGRGCSNRGCSRWFVVERLLARSRPGERS